jgi:hypothetical protein
VHNRVGDVEVSGGGLVSVNADKVNMVKVFSATRVRDRESLGEAVTAWIAHNADVRILKTFVMLSSDSRFHCLSIVLIGARTPDAG